MLVKNTRKQLHTHVKGDTTATQAEQTKATLDSLNYTLREQLSLLFSDFQLVASALPELSNNKNWKHMGEDFSPLFETLEEYDIVSKHFTVSPGTENLDNLCQELADTFKKKACEKSILFSLVDHRTDKTAFSQCNCNKEELLSALLSLQEDVLDQIPKNTCIHLKLDTPDKNLCAIHIELGSSAFFEDEVKQFSSGMISRSFFRKHNGIFTCKQAVEKQLGRFCISKSQDVLDFCMTFATA